MNIWIKIINDKEILLKTIQTAVLFFGLGSLIKFEIVVNGEKINIIHIIGYICMFISVVISFI